MSTTQTSVRTKTKVGVKIGYALLGAAAIASAYAILNTGSLSTSSSTTLVIVRPNLTVSSTSIARVGNGFTLSFAMNNAGTVAAGWPVGKSYYSMKWFNNRDEQIGSTFSEPLPSARLWAANSSTTISNDLNMSVGAKAWLAAPTLGASYLLVTVDPDNAVVESNELDNGRNVLFPVLVKPNLTIGSTSIARVGTGFTLSFVMNNSTTAAVSWPAGKSYYSMKWFNNRDEQIGSTFSEPLSSARLWAANSSTSILPGTTQSAAAKAWLAAPTYGASYMLVTVDPDNAVAETNELDNGRNVLFPAK